MALTREQVRAVAKLARLQLDEAEEAALAHDLAEMLEAFEIVQRLDTDGVEPMTCVDDFGGLLRDDAVTNAPADEALLGVAPARDGRAFRVPKILE